MIVKSFKILAVIWLMSGLVSFPAHSQQARKTVAEQLDEISRKMNENITLTIGLCKVLPAYDKNSCMNFVEVSQHIASNTEVIGDFLYAKEYVMPVYKDDFFNLFINIRINSANRIYQNYMNSLNSSLSEVNNSRFQVLGSEFINFYRQVPPLLRIARNS